MQNFLLEDTYDIIVLSKFYCKQTLSVTNSKRRNDHVC